jgi:acyl carrier protein
MATILERLKKIIAEQLGVDEEMITPEASFADDFNAGFSDMVELITAVEEKFSEPGLKVIIPDEAVDGIFTVQDIIDLLQDSVSED